MMEGKERLVFDGPVDLAQGDRGGRGGEPPAAAVAGLRCDQARGAQGTEDAPDDHRVGVDATGNVFGCDRRGLGLGEQGQGVDGDGEAGTGTHSISFCNNYSYK